MFPWALKIALVVLAADSVAYAQCPGHWDQAVSGGALTGAPGASASIQRLALLPNGDVAVGGFFTSAAGATSNNLAIYHPATNSWTALGSDPRLPGGSSFAVAPDGAVIGLLSLGLPGGGFGLGVARIDPAAQAVTSFLLAPTLALDGTLGVGPFTVAVDGTIIVTFTHIDVDEETTVAKVDPQTGAWSQIGSAFLSSRFLLAALPDGRVAAACSSPYRYPRALIEEITAYTPSSGAASLIRNAAYFTYSFPPGITALLALSDGDLVLANDIRGTLTADPLIVERYNFQSNTWSRVGPGLGPVQLLAELPRGPTMPSDILAATAEGLYRYRPGAAAWTRIPPTSGGSVATALGLPGGDLLVAGSSGTEPFLARYVFAPGSSCPGDYDCSGSLAANDIFDFVGDWFAGISTADFNGSGLAVQDIFDFLAAWFAGCP